MNGATVAEDMASVQPGGGSEAQAGYGVGVQGLHETLMLSERQSFVEVPGN